MNKKETRYSANLGSSSLILIFIVLCLVTFGMLSLSAAKNDWNLAKRSADSVTGYYEADSAGEAFYAMVRTAVLKARKETDGEEARKEAVKEALGAYYQENGTAVTQVPMERGQALYIELALFEGDGTDLEIKNWKVIQTEDYEIDTSMPVWSGVEGNK